MFVWLIMLAPWLFLIFGIVYPIVAFDDRGFSLELGYDPPSSGEIIGNTILIMSGVPLSWFIILTSDLTEADWRFIPVSAFAGIVLILCGCGIRRESREDQIALED